MNGDFLLDILNDSNIYVVVLDHDMNIRFVNLPLAKRLGFETKEQPLGRCWLDFIPENIKDRIKTVHASIVYRNEQDYREFTNYVVALGGEKFKVKWFNTAINHETHWTFSFGVPQEDLSEITEESIREHFRNAIESDKTMIKSLKDYVKRIPEKFNLKTCDLSE